MGFLVLPDLRGDIWCGEVGAGTKVASKEIGNLMEIQARLRFLNQNFMIRMAEKCGKVVQKWLFFYILGAPRVLHARAFVSIFEM